MNIKEYMLTCAAEEASEVAQAISKGLRFGTDYLIPNSNFITNAAHIIQEVNELIGVIELLGEYGFIDTSRLGYFKAKEDKKDRLQKYMQISMDLGVVKDD